MAKPADPTKFLVGTSFKLPAFDDARRSQMKRFWEERGFKFILTDEKLHLARRGTFVKTFFSTNPQFLETKLTATWSQERELECIMEVNLFMQQISEWHKGFLELEMITFESYMLNDDRKTPVWRQFEEDMRQADRIYLWTAGICARKMPAEAKRKYLGR